MFKIIVSLAGIQFLQAAVQVFKMKFVALMLGPDGLGVISLINQFIQVIMQVSTISLPWVATRFMAVAHSHGHEEFADKVKVFFRAILNMSIIGTACGLFFLMLFDHFHFSGLSEYKTLALISIGMVLPMGLRGFLVSVFTTAGKYRFAAVTMFLSVLWGSIAMLLGAWLWGLTGFFVCQAFSEYMMLIYCLVKMKSEMGLRPLSGKVEIIRELKKLHGSFELAVYGGIISFLSPMALMVLRYSLFNNGGEKLVGLYQAVHGLVFYITVAFGQATNLYLDPILKSDISPEQKIKTANSYLQPISLLLGTIMVVVVTFPDFFLRLLYSIEFAGGAEFLYAIMLIEGINMLTTVYLGLLIGQGWYRVHFILGLCVQVSIGLLSYLFVPHFGIWGAVLGLGTAAVLALTILFVKLVKEFGMFWKAKEVLLPLLIICFIAVMGGWFAFFPQQSDWLPSGIHFRLLSLLVYGFGCFVAMGNEARKKAYEVVRNKLAKITVNS